MTISGAKASLAPLWAAVLCLAFAACTGGKPQVRTVTGSTMGTGYRVSWVGGPEEGELRPRLEALLEQINDQMSTYRENSEISQFNRERSTAWFSVSEATARVVQEALRVAELTGGALDVTVGPLVDLWGFGPKGRVTRAPTPQAIDSVRKGVGYRKLQVRLEPPALKKDSPDLRVDLSAIAKGYGVDALAALVASQRVSDYLVEIGGEIRVAGTKAGTPWKIAIEKPEAGSMGTLQRILGVTNTGLATSGDYRNYFEEGGIRYSHTLDPRTGRPINHSLASVTVLASECMTADALATALNVLGPEAGWRLAREKKWAVYLLVREGEGFVEKSTPEFDRAVEGE